MFNLNDSVLLMLVGMLNFLGAILLAHARVKDEGVDPIQLPAYPTQAQASGAEAARGSA